MNQISTPAILKKCRVLLVEDERIVREIVVRMLRRLGIVDVVEASCAETAWGYLVGTDRKGFHLVISDITLPGVSGAKFIKTLRSLPAPQARTMPVIVLTADSSVETYKTLAGAHVSSYLIKPISTDMLLQAINRALGLVSIEPPVTEINPAAIEATGVPSGSTVKAGVP